jgi:hypothetical protein
LRTTCIVHTSKNNFLRCSTPTLSSCLKWGTKLHRRCSGGQE